MKKVFFGCDWASSWDWFQKYIHPYYTKFHSSKFELVSDPHEADLCVYGNRLSATADKSKSLIYQFEPKFFRNEGREPEDNIRYSFRISDDPALLHHVPVHPYQITLTNSFGYVDIQQIPRNKNIISILSNRCCFEGHKKRFDFMHAMEKFKIPLELWGTIFPHTHVHNKITKLAEYRYAFCLENSCEPGYFTEKFWDAILAETLPFYWGCPNLTNLGLPVECYIPVYRDDPLRSAKIVYQALHNNEWEKRLPYIRLAKKILIEKMSLFAIVEKFL